MTHLTTALLSRACAIFLRYAYPGGAVPATKRAYAPIAAEQPLEPLLAPPVAQVLPTAPPEPRLQIAPSVDLKSMRAADDARLHGDGWLDRSAGVLHIPIERAMELTSEATAR